MPNKAMPINAMRLLHVSCLVTATCWVSDGFAEPLPTTNTSPISGLLGLPSMRDAAVLAPRQYSLSLDGSLANNYSVASAAASSFGQALNFDGETGTVRLTAALGLGHGWEVNVEIARVSHRGGELDSFIEDWHSTWGLPNGNRQQVAQDQLNYSYSDQFSTLFLTQSRRDWGDSHIAVTKLLGASGSSQSSLRAGIKLGTGSLDSLTGSGAEDYYLSVQHSSDVLNGAVRWHAQLGYLYAGTIDVLQHVQRQHLWFTGVGVTWKVWRQVRLQAQLDSHAAPLHSSLRAVGTAPLLLSAGVNWSLPSGWSATVAFVEDLNVATAPDITLQFGLRYQPRPH
ncbi:MAG: hypothetical protein ACI9R8_002334 [Candidatus Paceibacteria bacterium]|jgi:hypothetical protein